jgi:hypothetical protein
MPKWYGLQGLIDYQSLSLQQQQQLLPVLQHRKVGRSTDNPTALKMLHQTSQQ